MRSLYIDAALAGITLALTTGAAFGQAKSDFGKREYDSSCAVCHGLNGKGDGPYKPFQTKSPSDLTQIAKANKGVFPYQRVYEIIDGRQAVAAHGPRDMPIWGARYSAQAGGYYIDVPYDPDVFIRTRITALVDYVYRLQAK
jgi:mono/diheme cytochrome c family protein